jgi:hypothetical protein
MREINADVHYVVTTINGEIKYAEGMCEAYKSKGLLFSAIEAEGYLRACLTIKESLSEWNESIDEAFKACEEENNNA